VTWPRLSGASKPMPDRHSEQWRRVCRSMLKGEAVSPADEPVAREVLHVLIRRPGGNWYPWLLALSAVWAAVQLVFGHRFQRVVWPVIFALTMGLQLSHAVRVRRLRKRYASLEIAP
jgi:hypothetical protein